MRSIDGISARRTRQFFSRSLMLAGTLLHLLTGVTIGQAAEPLGIWPDLAPYESSRETGTAQPPRKGEIPPITRLIKIRRPTMDVFLPENPNGTAILVLPGGGFVKVVPDMEGSEAAPFLNEMGIAVFVLRYRTNETTPKDEAAWLRPLQDAQRAMRLIRSKADEWKIQKDRVGVLGFSAGGQVASILHTATGDGAYEAIDMIDKETYRPDFSLLIYPWNVTNKTTGELLPEIRLNEKSPPAFIVHTHDDRSTSLGSVLIYAGLKRHNVPAELHIYENGGHGYGMRARKNSNIGTWPDRATDWLQRRGLGRDSNSEK
jgi:acetyl esterase/lipase